MRVTVPIPPGPPRPGDLTLQTDDPRLIVKIAMNNSPWIELTPFQAQQLGTMLLEAAETVRRAATALGRG